MLLLTSRRRRWIDLDRKMVMSGPGRSPSRRTHNMQQAARVSDFTAYMYLGELIEFSATDEIFIKPRRKETEDYITGRFG